MTLTVKQQRFVECYNGNATEAAIQAGYSPKWAHKFASNLMGKNRQIADAIKEREEKRVNSLIATREERQSFWTAIMRDEETELKDRLRASELLAKSEADFMEKVFDATPPLAPAIQVCFVKADTASEG